MDSDQAKLFVGGISWETSEEKLKDYFGQYGDVLHVNIMKDKATGKPRGFGFILFSDPSVLDRVILDKHTIDGRPVEAKRAMSREDQQSAPRTGSNGGGRNVGAGGNMRTKKIFVGGLPPPLTEEYFRQYFENFGPVNDVVIMYDQNTQRPRGFGFVTFDSEDAVDMVLQKSFHDLNGKQVEVKRAFPKDANPGMGNRGGGGDGSGYNASANQNAYESRIDSNRYVQPQNTGGGYPPYASSGYGAAGYGYGAAANNGMGYGGYAHAGYGGGNPGYMAPTSAAYGNPNNPGAPRGAWNAQTAAGYGAAGYGNAGAWGASGAGGGGPTGQSPGAGSAAGYGSQQGYGYGDGSYGGQAGYGSTGNRGGDSQGNTAGYGSGYGDANGHGGYGASANGAHGAQMGYGGGYGGTQNRQGQQ